MRCILDNIFVTTQVGWFSVQSSRLDSSHYTYLGIEYSELISHKVSKARKNTI